MASASREQVGTSAFCMLQILLHSPHYLTVEGPEMVMMWLLPLYAYCHQLDEHTQAITSVVLQV